MNVLITGGKGFLAKEMVRYFSDKKQYTLMVTDRSTLDPTDYENFLIM
jgi:dTDP-4-dehydrorhamnose reductase